MFSVLCSQVVKKESAHSSNRVLHRKERLSINVLSKQELVDSIVCGSGIISVGEVDVFYILAVNLPGAILMIPTLSVSEYMEMPDLLKITSNIGYLVVIALLLYLLFCCLFVYSLPVLRSRLSDIGWKRVDYFWLAAAVVGLAFQSEQIRIGWYTSNYESYQLNVSLAELSVKHYAKALTDGYFCKAPRQETTSIDEAVGTEEEFRRACAQFEVFKSIDLSVPLYMSAKFASAAEHIDEILPSYENTEIKKRLARLGNAYKHYDQLWDGVNESRHKTDPFEFEMILHWTAPLLLAFALALRFAKVTGEIRLKTHPIKEVEKPIISPISAEIDLRINENTIAAGRHERAENGHDIEK